MVQQRGICLSETRSTLCPAKYNVEPRQISKRTPRKRIVRVQSTHEKDETSSSLSSVFGPLFTVAALFSYTPPALASGDVSFASTSSISVKREVIEDMLVQRFERRIKGMSDAELADVTERLLAEQSPFPIDLLLPPPPPPQQLQQQQQLQLQQQLPFTTSSPTVVPVEREEEVDDATAALFTALRNDATQGAAQSASAVLVNPATIGKAVGVGAGFAAAVPAVMALLAKRAENAAEKELKVVEGRVEVMEEEVEESNKKNSSWFGWLFQKKKQGVDAENVTDDAPLPSTSFLEPSAAAPRIPLPPSSSSVEASAAVGSSSSTAANAQTGQVLWRRKDDTQVENSSSNGSSSSNGQVLWRRNDETPLPTSTSAKKEQDLWRVPLETLKLGGGDGSSSSSSSGGEREQASQRQQMERKLEMSAPPLPPAGVVPQPANTGGGRKARTRLRESALDNAEPH